MNKCGDCIRFEKCKEYTDPNETYAEVGGCKNFVSKMPNNLTDAEIKKALAHIIRCNNKQVETCDGCLIINAYPLCEEEIIEQAFYLINRQDEKIERLLQKTQRPQDADPMDFCGVLCDFAEGLIAKATAKAYKEFAERLKEKITTKYNEYEEQEYPRARIEDIDNLLKEMVGGSK